MTKQCEIEGCKTVSNEVCGKTGKYKMNLCQKHRFQMDKHGKILERTMYDSNEIVKYNDYAEIILYGKGNKECGRTLIDIEDIPLVSQHKWYINGAGYVVTNNPSYQLHRLVMGNPKELSIDHVFHNTLDNRKDNLRVCTHQENLCNQKTKITNTSGVTGVSWHKAGNKWRVQICINGRKLYLGSYCNVNDAITVRKEAEVKYFGDFVYGGDMAC